MNSNLKTSEKLQGKLNSSYNSDTRIIDLTLILLIVINVVLGLILYKMRQIATIHAILLPLVTILSLFRRKPQLSVALLSYIANSHVLWRMTKAHVFWEYSKYASIILIILILIRYVKHLKNFILPGLFLFFLSLSIPLTINYYRSIQLIRRAISFNLAGPVLLAFSTMLFYNIKIKKSEMQWILLSLSMPAVSISSISLYSLLTKRIVFTETSNFIASGGFGPNQVSATLGLGSLIMLILAINYYKRTTDKIVLYTISLWLFIQSLLTFSRGGVFNFAVALTGFLWYSIKDHKTRLKVLSGTVILSIFILITLPKVQRITQGQLKERFTNLNPTGRDKIALAEIQLFEEHPLFGVGPGVGIAERTGILGYYIAPHTEFSRLLGEHGIFGLMALILLMIMLYIPVKNVIPSDKKGENVAFILWSAAEMAHSATRIAITGFLPGIAYLNIHREDDEE